MIIIISVFIITYWNDTSLKRIGLHPKTSFLKTIGTGLLLFLLLEPILDFIIQPLVNKLTGEVADYSAFKSVAHNFSKFLKYFVFILISAGFGEEILFRGFLFRQFSIILPNFKFKTAVIIVLSAVLFSIPHLYQGISGLIMTFIFGLIFAIVYVKTNYNLWVTVTIVLHSLIDSMFITLSYFDKLNYYELANSLFFGY
ncbi:CPBP family intramembrane glutamic endopeptidase [Tenacibaculum adriaticum]|uniref:CPBP family intramembrane glutamic endopeptidase n=1 Tax=Tenacibaculum adriaticum TaxID=413713 RepID=UPI0011E777F7